MFNFFKKKSKTNELTSLFVQLKQDHDSLMEFIKDHGPDIRYCSLQRGPCTTRGFYYWRKDIKHNYIYSNPYHCEQFLGFDPGCSFHIEGKNDYELLTDYQHRTHKPHAFLDQAMITDELIEKELKEIRFILLGKIADELMVLDITKTPTLTDGVFDGSHGFGFNVNGNAKHTKYFIEKGLGNEMISCVFVSDDLAIYRYTQQEKELFANGFPI